MKTKFFARVILALGGVTIFWLSGSPPAASAVVPAASYCSVPQMPGAAVKPNVLLLLDNSASMYDPAYTDPASYCVDDSYDNNKSYVGYFNQQSAFSYDGAKSDFVDGASLPAPGAPGAAASTSYLYVEMTGTAPNRKVSVFKASGNFLNWLSMSKLDIEKKVLTGGKYNNGMLLAETRGCQGKRFVKIAPEATQITFGVRGPIPPNPNYDPYSDPNYRPDLPNGDDDYINTAGHGGQARIEIYDKHYNKSDCLAAVADWQQPNKLNALRNDASNCMGGNNLCEDNPLPNPNSDPPGQCQVPTKSQVFIDIVSDCYAHPPPNVLGDGTVANDPVLSDCAKRVHAKYDSNPVNIFFNTGDDICAQALSHSLTVWDGEPVSTGFLGDCYNIYDVKDPFPDPVCVEREAEDYCRDITSPVLTDASTKMNVPSFILDAGIYSVGEVAGTYLVRVAAPVQPTGLVQEFSGDINFGAMIFNDNGSGSECKHEDTGSKNGGINAGDIACVKRCIGEGAPDAGAECHTDNDCYDSCQEIPLKDGGQIISPINSSSDSLVASLNQVRANSWTPLAESLYTAMGYFGGRSDLRLQATDFGGPAPPSFGCQKNNLLIVSDGVSAADRNPQVNSLVAKAAQDWAGQIPPSMTTTGGEASPPFQGSYNLDDLAWIARNKNLADFNLPIVNNKDFLSTHVVYTGVPCGDYNADGTCKTSDEGVPEKLMQLTAAKGGGMMVNAQNSADLEAAFRTILQKITVGAGAATSILSTGNGNGAIFIQEQFYPFKSFDGGATSATWIGEMQSLWYSIDPFLGQTAGAGSTIREDTDGDLKLNLKKDRIVNLRYDAASNQSYADLTVDSNGDGSGGGGVTRVAVDQLKSLWRAGQTLWARDLTVSPRTIYTPWLAGGTQTGGTGLMPFSYGTIGSSAFPDNSSTLQPYLQMPDPASTIKLMKYVHGFDLPGDATMRSRTVTIGGIPAAPTDPQNKGIGVWKLGDIVSSNPQVQSPVPLGSYQLPSPSGYNDVSYQSFINSNDYNRRGRVYVGANDGMLHAFNLGKLDASVSGGIKATLSGPDLGKEQWAFIPKNALPYLNYLADPNYRHLFYVDGTVTLVDASIGDTNGGSCSRATYWNCPKGKPAVTAGNDLDSGKNTWRTVLIAGMGLGGATSVACSAGSNCVRTPLADPGNPAAGLGYSSYFALDVTDPDNPSLLWEFSDPALGFSTSGPAIVRIGSDVNSNGRWFAVFGSGPTGPIDANHQFLANSSQELKFFVVDLRTGELLATIPTGIANAFAGSMVGASIDADRWNGSYQDDALYVGYSQMNTGSVNPATNWSGGVIRIMTKESNQDNMNPTQWTLSRVIDGIGPVTSNIARLQDRKNHNLWLYFGTGRYFFNQDDMQGSRALYGVKELCYNAKVAGVDTQQNKFNDPNCNLLLTAGSLVDQSSTQNTITSGNPGWFINLDPATSAAGAERLITNPTSITGGAVFFATFQPGTDPCLPGSSYLWGLKYDTGGAIPNGSLQGKVLVPLSTGSSQETGLSGNLNDKGGRRSAQMTGKPGGVKVVSNSGLKPLKKIIHIQER